MKAQHGRDLAGDEMAQVLDEFVNGANENHIQDFVAQVTKCTHRTLQQSIMRLFVATIEAWASLPESRYDLRNEATIKLCKKIVQATGDKYDRYLPTV